MNRLNLLLSRVVFGAILLLLASSAAFSQVSYTLTGTLNLASGKDPLGLSGKVVTATATINQTMVPTSVSTTSTASSNTYSGVAVGINVGGLQLACTVPSTPSVTVTLTDNVGAPDTIQINDCDVSGLATVSALATIPDGRMITAVPANIPSTSLSSGTVNFLLTGATTPGSFNLTNAALAATGTVAPSVTPSPAAWTPSAQMGSTTSLTQPVTFTTTPSALDAAVSFSTSVTTTDGGTWLSVSPAGTNTGSPITITINPTGLTQPSYTGNVILTYGPSYSTLKIPVTFTLTAPPVALTGPSSMTFNYTLGDAAAPASQTLNIGSSPASTASVTASVASGNSWLSIAPPTSGNLPASFTISVNTSGLSAGTLNGSIQIASAGANNSPLIIPVTYNVSGSTLTVPSTPLTFNYTVGAATPTAQSVSISGTAGISFTTSTGAASAWLSATPSGTVPSSISISINAAGLAGLSVGPHTGSVTVTSTGATGSPASIPVTLNVLAPVLTTNTSQLNFSYQLGSGTQPASQPISVGDASNVNFTATPATTSGGAWLSVNPGTGSASGSVSVLVNTTGLAAGIYSGTVTIAATGATSQVVNVTLTVASVTIGTPSLSFAFQVGGAVPSAQTVNIGGTAGLAFTATPFTTSGGSWLSVTPGGTISGSSSISVSVVTTGLGVATYNGTITVAAPGAAPQTINVTLTVSNTATLSASPSMLSFTYTLGLTAPAAQNINVGGTSGLNFTATAATTSGGSWLASAPVSPGTTPGIASVSIVTTGLVAGTYAGTVTVGASGATSQVVNVTLVVSNNLTVSTNSLTFNYTVGGAAPASQPINIGGTSGIAFTATASTTTGGSWLAAAPVSPGTIPGSANVSIVTTGLTTPGTFAGTVVIAAPNAASQTVNVSIVVVNNITVSTSTLSFTYAIGASAPASQPLTIGGSPGLSFTTTAVTTTGGSWLAAAPVSPGTAPGTANVSIVTTGLTTAGTFTGMVTVAASGATSQVVKVTLVVTAQPTITSSSTALSFTYNIGGTAPASQTLTITGTSGLAYTSTASTVGGVNWLTATPVAPGTIPGTTTVSIVTTGLTTAGTFMGTVVLAAPGAVSQTVNVTLTVAVATITASPTSLSFTYQIGGTMPNPKSITVGGTSGLAFTATAATTPAGGSWLTATAVSPGTVSGTASVGIVTAGLTTPGTFTGTVTIAAPGATSQMVKVTLTVTTAPLTASNPSLSFKFTIGGTAPGEQPLNILGGEGLAFTAAPGSGASWLSVTESSGTLPILLTVSVNPKGLTAGAYHSNVIITAPGAPNSPFSVPVTLTVAGGASTITLSNSSLSFTATIGGAAPTRQTVNVTGSSPTKVSVSTVGAAWLSATVAPATTPSVVRVSVDQTNLAAGSYMGTVVVTAAGASDSPQNISVQLVVSAPVLTATPPNLSFAFTPGGSAPAAQTINITSTAQVTITTSTANGSWLTLTNSSSTTPAILTASVNAASLTPGAYSATISVTSPGAINSPMILTVALVVSPKPNLSASPTSLTFTGEAGGTNPASQSINVTGGTLPITIATTPGWLSVSASANTTPSTLVATVNTTGMAKGNYQGSITITSSTAGNSPVTIPVTLSVTAPLVTTGPTISTIVSAASYDSSGFAPGAIVSIFGSLLGPQTGVSFSLNSQGSVDPTLAGATVTAAGVSAIPLFVQNGQVNVILPYTLGSSGTATVELEYNNQTTQLDIPLTAADVQIFTADASGGGPGSILNQDFSVNSASNPAPAGTVVQIFGTGGGALKPAVNVGEVAGDTLSWVTLPYSATVNGETASVLYAGSAPGLVYGVYQFNVQLPSDAPSGSVKIVLNVGGSMSQPNVTVFVK